ncbi:MAG: zinc metallopeptidase [Pseudomonadota bacterium]
MALLYTIGALIFLAVIFLPQYWVRHVIRKYSTPRSDFPGTGGELAQHLIDHYELHGVGVERITDQGDHYDPLTRTVRLSAPNYDGRSLSAVAIAAHEVSHAIQHMRGERLLSWRQSLVKILVWTDRFAIAFFTLAPLLALAARTPAALILFGSIGFLILAARVAVHLITLPVELDASFRKALPILEQGGYLNRNDLPGARAVLKAAAMTYVAQALMSLLDILRFARFGR